MEYTQLVSALSLYIRLFSFVVARHHGETADNCRGNCFLTVAYISKADISFKNGLPVRKTVHTEDKSGICRG